MTTKQTKNFKRNTPERSRRCRKSTDRKQTRTFHVRLTSTRWGGGGFQSRASVRLRNSQELRDALTLAKKIEEMNEVSKTQLDNVAHILEITFDFRHTQPVIDSVEMVDVEISSSISVRDLDINEAMPVITKISPLDKTQEGIQLLPQGETENKLAHWSDYPKLAMDRV